ncbi:MAG: class I SAM-dependent methyltransferase [Sphingomonadales bacterium]|nr:class I SAM-dependent methyltransferase [Sphingomonadales bacterium]
MKRWLPAGRPRATPAHAVRDYRRMVRRRLREYPQNRSLALARAIGASSMAEFHDYGMRQVAVLRHHGLSDGMAIYDLGCGCGRTAQALYRSGWKGQYKGADVIGELVDEVRRTCPGYSAVVHRPLSIASPDGSLDMLFHWSVFTHLYPEEGYVYLQDIFRALKPAGKLVFSFLEMGHPLHASIFDDNVRHLLTGKRPSQLNQFLHRDWIAHFARRIGFVDVAFTDGADGARHPAFGQSLVAMRKPSA